MEHLRKEFEAWISKPPFEKIVARHSENGSWPGNYRDYGVQLAWCAWQDSRLAAPITPSIDAAHEMGAKGGPVVEAERLAFEAWMKGHCWALSARWDGKQYIGDREREGELDFHAVGTRRLWAAWRDRAALSSGAHYEAIIASLQAKIDELMLEHCPEEMTKEQIDEWARHQEPVSEDRKDAELWRDLVSHQKFNNVPAVGYAINRAKERQAAMEGR